MHVETKVWEVEPRIKSSRDEPWEWTGSRTESFWGAQAITWLGTAAKQPASQGKDCLKNILEALRRSYSFKKDNPSKDFLDTDMELTREPQEGPVA